MLRRGKQQTDGERETENLQTGVKRNLSSVDVGLMIIFNSPINGRQYKKQHRKKKKSGNNGNLTHGLDYTISNTSNDNLLYRFEKRVITCFILH